MTSDKSVLTTVIDAGARYGIHPTWEKFNGELLYLAFEPDKEESERLSRLNTRKDYEVINCALDNIQGEKNLHIAKHRGCSSFLLPDDEKEWFGSYRVGQGDVESVVKVKTVTIDSFAEERGLEIDFIKVDTEGTELEVIEGGRDQLRRHIMGIRTTAYFQADYKGQRLFPEMQNFLKENGFYLLNLDYFGRGVPALELFRSPDPLSPDFERYGTLRGVDGVWLKEIDFILGNRVKHQKMAVEMLKYAYFCLLNNAPDVGLNALLIGINEHGINFDTTTNSRLYKDFRKVCARYLGRWRVYPDYSWLKAKDIFKTIFHIELLEGHEFWEMYQSL